MKKKKKYKLKPLGKTIVTAFSLIIVALVIVFASNHSKDELQDTLLAQSDDEPIVMAVESETKETEQEMDISETANVEVIKEEKQVVAISIENEEEQYFITITDGESVIQEEAQYEQTEKMEIFTIDTVDYKIPLMSQLTLNDNTYHCSEVATLKEGIAGEYTVSNGKDVEDTYLHGSIAIITQGYVSYFE